MQRSEFVKIRLLFKLVYIRVPFFFFFLQFSFGSVSGLAELRRWCVCTFCFVVYFSVVILFLCFSFNWVKFIFLFLCTLFYFNIFRVNKCPPIYSRFTKKKKTSQIYVHNEERKEKNKIQKTKTKERSKKLLIFLIFLV